MDAKEFQDTVDREMRRVEGTLDQAGREIMRKDSKARTALVYFSTMLFVFGILMFVVSGYAVSYFGGNGWTALIGTGASYLGFIAGAFCIVSASFACAATYRQNRVLLCCSLLFSFIFFVVQCAAAAGMIAYSYTLHVGSTPSGSLTLITDVVTNNVMLSLFQKCCSGCPPNVVTCNNPTPGAFFNGTHPNCVAPSSCSAPVPCTSMTQTNCYVWTTEYLSRLTVNGQKLVPPVALTDDICATLGTLNSHGHKIVGPAYTGACGGGNPKNFMSQVAAYMEHVLGGVAVVFIIVAVVQGFLIGLSLYIICRPMCTGKSGFEDDMTGLGQGLDDDHSATANGGQHTRVSTRDDGGVSGSGGGKGAAQPNASEVVV